MIWYQKKIMLRFLGAGLLLFLTLAVGLQSNTLAFTDSPPDPTPTIDPQDETQFGNQIIIEDSYILDEAVQNLVLDNPIEKAEPIGLQRIYYEDFEGTWPGPGWSVYDFDGATNGTYYWGKEPLTLMQELKASGVHVVGLVISPT